MERHRQRERKGKRIARADEGGGRGEGVYLRYFAPYIYIYICMYIFHATAHSPFTFIFLIKLLEK